ncbi:MAG: methyltransferase domain-containing protein [Deltaproteobacteria bacterium]|nr:methyltransferase domain-containing protein [Deltaproteobacteria bacterium]MBW2113020.1 methyltransferase domain-containing protein [Deltaproteobacteria bacterium]MBW2354238.1 methyltransferase domain-containing protein [Deltaproteobacteria bacterium]HDZ89779.1 methyltransferase domain-containing protein [Deltaproteobacteria bacterium]
MFSLESFLEEYETDSTDLVIRERRFRFFVPKSIDRFLDPGDLLHDFPLWARIWEASIVLSHHLAEMPVDLEKRFLEIGCGMGVVGVVASAFGHRVTMSEYNPHALNFARANARVNLAADEPNPKIVQLDWGHPHMDGMFDYIIGSEVIYKEEDYQPILKLINTCLRPSGEVVLAEGLRKTSMEFFRQVSDSFNITARKKVLRSTGEEVRVVLASMRASGS